MPIFPPPFIRANPRLGFILLSSCPFAVAIRGCDSRLPLAVSFTDTKLAEDPPEEVFGIMSPDDITDSV